MYIIQDILGSTVQKEAIEIGNENSRYDTYDTKGGCP